MAEVYMEVAISVGAEQAWEVIGDFVEGPARMAPGFVVECRADGDLREVTFADGVVARERLVARDDRRRRIVYSLVGGTMSPEHDNATMQVLPDGTDRCRLLWVHDVLPDELAEPMRTAMEQGATAIARSLAGPIQP